MIVSASYRTDIPAFYPEWFLNRLRAGFCRVPNPYGGPDYAVSLRNEDVGGFVFWTKNAGPFLSALHEVRLRSLPFVVQFTINGYPRELEHAVTDSARAVEHARQIALEYGPRAVVWRYDTILDTSLTPPDFHRANFEKLARSLEGSTDEVVVSFAQIYRKTRRNMDAAARAYAFGWSDPNAETKRGLCAELAACARAHGIQMTVCSQPSLLAGDAQDARCIDAKRLSDVAGYPIRARLKGNRPECGCHESRDIGVYDTCPHGCVYCYAVKNRALARRRFAAHDPNAESLATPPLPTRVP